MRPDDRKYTASHEWAKADGDTFLIGITDFAVNELCSGNASDLVYCDLPEPGRELVAGDTFGEIESVKAVADLHCPIAGTVVEINSSIEDNLEILSEDPWNRGWMVRVKPATDDTSHLMDLEAYEKHLNEVGH